MSEQILKTMMDAGIPEATARAMIKSLEPRATKAKAKTKKAFFPGFTKREKINAPVVVNKTCRTCKTTVSFKTVVSVYSDEVHIERNCTTSLCENCIKMFESMDKSTLVKLLVLKNHPDIEIKTLTTAQHIQMAEKKTAIEWLVTKLNHCIPWEAREPEFVEDSNEEVA